MPEGKNVEMAHRLAGEGHAVRSPTRRRELIEVLEVLILAVVAVATAWSGFQAAKWDGRQSLLYGEASSLRFQADAASTYAGQTLSADAGMLTAWLQAQATGDGPLAEMIVRRFTPDYRVAFDAWLKTDPLHSKDAPPGPAAMPEYRNPDSTKAEALNARAGAAFQEGTEARETADRYVRVTVLFASVLFFVAIAQRFQVRGVRIATNAVAVAVLVFAMGSMVALSRL